MRRVLLINYFVFFSIFGYDGFFTKIEFKRGIIIEMLLKIKLDISKSLEEKIFDIRTNSGEDSYISKITSYFPLSDMEKKEIIDAIKDTSFDKFHSIFSDSISDEEWKKNKSQIQNKFKSELFDIDNSAK